MIIPSKKSICISHLSCDLFFFFPWYEECEGNSCVALLLGFDALLSESPYFNYVDTAQ